ncbi:hypothetical protein [Natrinema hispanicum]|uniref:Uncharacterized protein n=1 Tax=Natrinema hispanicum TaxID=392421 RepID=A0A1G6KYX5_9EURY|nr:hypothetical protein [Natrinema hispanicum]SDC36008.1 hypothetical protein SAMN05192552_1003123 [Natrinema hispanicum]
MAVVLGLVVVMALVVPFLLWLLIDQETSNPTIVDRADAERIAKERGGRQSSTDRTSDDDDDRDESRSF